MTASTASVFAVAKLDCPAEARLIRSSLANVPGILWLEFDLPGRQLMVVHEGTVEPILARLEALGLGATLRESSVAAAGIVPNGDTGEHDERRTLRLLLAINAVMFTVEIGVGLAAESTGLVADSLDMFADAAVYGLALAAVGRHHGRQRRAARAAGWLQALLALGAVAEVVRRFLHGSEPASGLMIGVGMLALAANVTCLFLSARQCDRGVHMKASYIFSANDVLANLGVIVAGLLVAATGSPWPDLLIGAVIAAVVLHGARRILRLGT